MDKTGLAALVVGIILFIVGIVLMWNWLSYVIKVVLGGIGIVFVFVGLVAIVLGCLMIKE